jgi:hypothetical protein
VKGRRLLYRSGVGSIVSLDSAVLHLFPGEATAFGPVDVIPVREVVKWILD